MHMPWDSLAGKSPMSHVHLCRVAMRRMYACCVCIHATGLLGRNECHSRFPRGGKPELMCVCLCLSVSVSVTFMYMSLPRAWKCPCTRAYGMAKIGGS